MTRTLSHTVTQENDGIRIDAFLAKQELYSSRSVAVHYIEDKKVFLNGKIVAKKQVVSSGDFIVYEEEAAPEKVELVGQAIKLDIRYEDEYLLVLSKQAGLICHPSPDHHDNTLVNALIHFYGKDGLCNVQGEEDRPGIVHRLDMDTTGLMLAAKTDDAGQALMDAIREREVDRRYITLVHGNIAHDNGMIDAPIARSLQDRTKMTVRDSESARNSVTTFKVLERFEAGPKDNGYTLLECKLYTGRTHQIRVHMQYIKHSCVGDPLYGSGNPSSQLGIDRQFLHSYLIEFEHPITHCRVQLTDALADDLQVALESIADRSMGKTEAGTEITSMLKPTRKIDCE